MPSRAVQILDGGKLVIPASFRRKLGFAVGDTVIVEMFEGELRIRSRNAALANARRMMRQLVPDNVSLVDELIAERRAEAARE